jgi:hypothetical protein
MEVVGRVVTSEVAFWEVRRVRGKSLLARFDANVSQLARHVFAVCAAAKQIENGAHVMLLPLLRARGLPHERERSVRIRVRSAEIAISAPTMTREGICERQDSRVRKGIGADDCFPQTKANHSRPPELVVWNSTPSALVRFNHGV